MGWISRSFNTLLGRDRQADRIAEEFEFHLEAVTRELIAEGMSPEDARAAARRRFGRVADLEQRTRDAGIVTWLDGVYRDTALAARSLARRKGLAVTAILTLSVGIGANTAIFSVADAALWKPLPLPQSDRLYVIEEMNHGRSSGGNPQRLADWAAQVPAFEAVSGQYGEGLVLSGSEGGPVRLAAIRSFGRFLATLGLQPAIGRAFTAAEERGEGAPVVLLSESLWRTRFGADPAIAGRTLRLNGASYTVIGVLGPELGSIEPYDLLAPAPRDVQRTPRKASFLQAIVRLRSGQARAQSELAAVMARLGQQYPDTDRDRQAYLTNWREFESREARKPLLLLQGTAGLVLLIACFSIAGLLLGRATEREREAAVRAALGASRGAILRLYLTESLLLAMAGGLAGVIAATLCLGSLVHWLPPELFRRDAAAVDWRVLLFGLAASLLAGLLCGWFPAWQAARRGTLQQTNRATEGVRTLWVRRALVVGQVAMSLALLNGAGLLSRSLANIQRQPLGFRPESLLAVQVNLPWDTPESRVHGLFGDALPQFEAIPGVRQVGLGDRLPLEGGSQSGPILVRGAVLAPDLEKADVSHRAVNASYLSTLGVPLLRGAYFVDQHEAVVNESFIRRYFGESDPLGREITFDTDTAAEKQHWFRISGVVADVRLGATRDPLPEVFVDYRTTYWPMARFVLRVSGDMSATASAVRAALARLDPEVVVGRIAPMDDEVRSAAGDQRTEAWLVGCFAFTALALAAIGLFGLLASDVAQRTQEIGVRMALGAASAEVLQAFVRRGVGLAAIGVALGAIGAAAVGRLIRSLLYGVEPLDPLVMLSAIAILLGTAVLASYLPARRAAAVDPIRALRHE